MPRWRLITIALVLIIVVISGVYVGLIYVNNNQPASNSPAGIRDQVIKYIAANHTETANFTSNLSWTGGKQQTGLLGSDTYLYNATDWYMWLNCSVVPNPLYQIDANYTRGDVTLDWQGTYQNGTVTEISYITYGLPITESTQEQARDDVLAYIATNHNETVQYLQVFSWSGGLVPNPVGFVGTDTYKYIGIGWNVTEQYPIVPNPIYQVNATYAVPNTPSGNIIVNWQGTWQNGTVTETKYAYTP